jgi:predicted transcriptional regulator
MTAIRRLLDVQYLLWLALILALVGSLRHVAWGFSTLEQGDLLAGYVQAVAVDIGLFALAVGIQERRKDGRKTWGLWFGVGLFSGVSTYANLLHGLTFASALTLNGWAWLVSIRPLVLSGVLPLLVVYLAEISAGNYQHAVKVAEKEQRKAERAAARQSSSLAEANATRAASKTAAMDALTAYLDEHPDASLSQAGQAIGRSKTTVASYLDELEAAGVIHRNGEGVQVT